MIEPNGRERAYLTFTLIIISVDYSIPIIWICIKLCGDIGVRRWEVMLMMTISKMTTYT